jgi:hypothetical protein
LSCTTSGHAKYCAFLLSTYTCIYIYKWWLWFSSSMLPVSPDFPFFLLPLRFSLTFIHSQSDKQTNARYLHSNIPTGKTNLFVVMSLLQRVSYILLPKHQVISDYFLVWTFELPDLDLIFILYFIRLVLSIRIGIFLYQIQEISIR